jgi:signal transduction histidine kinase/putative methionine-R-sulfoxide reductase with GAF domain
MTNEIPSLKGEIENIPRDRVASRDDVGDWLDQSDEALAQLVREMSTSELIERLGAIRDKMARQEAQLASMQEINSVFGRKVPIDELLGLIMDKITKLMNAERSSLFLVDEETGELWSKVSQGVVDREIRLQPGEGIAGWVAETGQSLNIKDAYRDPRFNPEYDRETGFTTDSILCQCVRNEDEEIVGVVQVLNSRSGAFTDQHEHLLSVIANQAAIAIENSRLYMSMLEKNEELRDTKRRLEKKVAELDLLYEVERELSQAVGLERLVESITQKTLELVDAEASALTLDGSNTHDRTYVLVDRVPEGPGHDWDFFERTVPRDDEGIDARARETGEPVICGDGRCDPVPDGTSESLGLDVDNALAVPLFDEDECIGSLKVANRRASDDEESGLPGFTDDDVKILTLIAGRIAGSVAARRHRERREKQKRLAAIGEALSGVLHDLKNPASIISGYVQLMVKEDDRARREEYAESIDQQFDQFNQMTRELLVFARGETNVVAKRVDIEAFMGELEKLLSEELNNKGVELELDVACEGTVQLDPAKVNRALLNLARNGAEATPDGGTIAISVTRDGDDLLFCVRDTGEGIPDEIRDRLYESFVTKGKQNGTGLGLSIVKKIVEDLEGEIDFETETGEGTTFYLRIPQPLDTSNQGE